MNSVGMDNIVTRDFNPGIGIGIGIGSYKKNWSAVGTVQIDPSLLLCNKKQISQKLFILLYVLA